jgi:hypothetical protein
MGARSDVSLTSGKNYGNQSDIILLGTRYQIMHGTYHYGLNITTALSFMNYFLRYFQPSKVKVKLPCA